MWALLFMIMCSIGIGYNSYCRGARYNGMNTIHLSRYSHANGPSFHLIEGPAIQIIIHDGWKSGKWCSRISNYRWLCLYTLSWARVHTSWLPYLLRLKIEKCSFDVSYKFKDSPEVTSISCAFCAKLGHISSKVRVANKQQGHSSFSFGYFKPIFLLRQLRKITVPCPCSITFP